MSNILEFLNFLKWNTDDKHSLTQEKIRSTIGLDNKRILGDKNTFRRLLFSIADHYNTCSSETGEIQLRPESDWRLIFPGYKIKKTDMLSTHSYYTGPIHYHHKINHSELYFLIMQLNCLEDEHRTNFSLRLIEELGSKYFYDKDLCMINSSNINKELQVFDFATLSKTYLYKNICIVQDAINRERLISFYTSTINSSGQICPQKEEHLISPYRIICYNGKFWLIGNRRLGSYMHPYSQCPKYHYADTLDVFRIDKLVNVTIKENRSELRAKTSFWDINLENCLDTLSSQIHVFKEHTKIRGTDISSEYGKMEFEILWENFPPANRNDYTFIYDTFGKNYSVRLENKKSIVCVQSTVECFIDWSLSNIDKIKILDTSSTSSIVKNELHRRLSIGMDNLRE